MRLIDADRAVEMAERIFGQTSFTHVVKQLVDRLPTIEAEPVRYGKWIINSDGYYPQCSECMEEPQQRVTTKYCPNCGAKMDGGSKDA